jgi:hypothetical protein
MIGPNGDANVDAFTAMPLEFEDRDVEPLRIAAPAINGKKSSKFDLQGMFWKFVASGSAATSAEVLACLASDESTQIRRRVAENANTPTEALSRLASDNVPAVRAAVARNPRTPVFILRTLSNDDDVSVRYAIASNPEMPDAILLSLFLDPDPYVAERASQNLAA